MLWSISRRFLEYMAESYKDYNENIYAKITIAELEEYILKTRNINSEKSVKNFFFYVNGFLYQKTKSEQNKMLIGMKSCYC